jgi:hypothetical protein
MKEIKKLVKDLLVRVAQQACVLCQENSLKSFSCSDGRLYFACDSCDYIFLNPEQRLSLAAERERYLEHDNNVQDPEYLKYLRKTWDKAEFKGVFGSRALDYGCGPTKGLKAVLQSEMVAVSSFDPIFFPDFQVLEASAYDVIFCSEALEHAYDPRLVVEHWVKSLKPRGRVTLRTSFHQGMGSLEDWWYAKDPTHVGFFSEITFRTLSENWGFAIEHLHSPYVVLRLK